MKTDLKKAPKTLNVFLKADSYLPVAFAGIEKFSSFFKRKAGFLSGSKCACTPAVLALSPGFMSFGLGNKICIDQFVLLAAILVVFLILAAFTAWICTKIHFSKLKTKYEDLELKETVTLFRTIYDRAPIGIAVVQNNHIIRANPMFENILGRDMQEINSMSLKQLIHPEDLQKDFDLFANFKDGGPNRYTTTKRFKRPDGKYIWAKITIVALKLDSPNSKSNYLCIIQDITEQVEKTRQLKESERSKDVLLSNLPGVAYRCKYDRDWTMLFLSQGCYELTGYHPESLIDNREISFNQLIAPEYWDAIWKEWDKVLKNKEPFRFEYEIITASGQRKWVSELAQGVYNEKGEIEALEGILIDITNQKIQEMQIKYLIDHDLLTMAYNRTFYKNALIEYDKQQFLPLSILIADINGLRIINDALGFSKGNILIKETATILQSCCTNNEFLARIGGDEFAILLPNTEENAAIERLEKINNAVKQHNKNKEKLYEISLSVGYATKQSVDENIDDTIKAAYKSLRNQKLLNRKSFHNQIISSMMAAVYEKCHETEEHAKRIAKMARKIGEHLKLSQKELDELELLSMLHDIGKIGINDSILKKPDRLTSQEIEIMKTHTNIGYRIAKASSELEPLAEYILTHHERWDGTGYPQGLKGKEIPLLSRILAVSDAFDAMTNDRIYRKAISPKAAVKELKKHSGTQFDPYIVKIFEKIVKQEKV